MKNPQVWTLRHLVNQASEGPRSFVKIGNDEFWVPARPLGFSSPWERLRCAWLVFTGRADAVIWPGGQ